MSEVPLYSPRRQDRHVSPTSTSISPTPTSSDSQSLKENACSVSRSIQTIWQLGAEDQPVDSIRHLKRGNLVATVGAGGPLARVMKACEPNGGERREAEGGGAEQSRDRERGREERGEGRRSRAERESGGARREVKEGGGAEQRQRTWAERGRLNASQRRRLT